MQFSNQGKSEQCDLEVIALLQYIMNKELKNMTMCAALLPEDFVRCIQ